MGKMKDLYLRLQEAGYDSKAMLNINDLINIYEDVDMAIKAHNAGITRRKIELLELPSRWVYHIYVDIFSENNR